VKGKMRALYYEKDRRKWIGGREREGREEEGICRTNVKVLPTPLIQEKVWYNNC